MERIYEALVVDHFEKYEQMAFLSGPRQVGKTTLSSNICKQATICEYLNWDKTHDRETILAGEKSVIAKIPMDAVLDEKPLVVLDEIHKYPQWKNFLKGFIDEHKGKLNILVTGSAKLDVICRGGDSLMGRYFPYHIHPLSLRELKTTTLSSQEIRLPDYAGDEAFDALFHFSGFPEPFIKQDNRFSKRWHDLRQEQLIRGDIRDVEKIYELAQLEVLAEILKQQATKTAQYSTLAKKVRVSDSTIRRWMSVLESFFYCFSIRPWYRNVSKSLLKEPKVYLWDWSVIDDKGAKTENFVACHLMKAIDYWNDMGMGSYALHYLRDKNKREVDFLISKDNQPWIMLEVKRSVKEKLSSNLLAFNEQINAPHVLQLAFDMPYQEIDCFDLKEAKIVPLKTFLAQLI